MPTIQVARLRDLARLLRRLNNCGSRHEAVYLLRFLVARLCSSSYRGMPGAKNLKPEITRVRLELAEFMNGPFAGPLTSADEYPRTQHLGACIATQADR